MEQSPVMSPAHQHDAGVFPMRVDHFSQWLLDQAANQTEWPMDKHQEFLDGIAQATSEATDEELSLPLPPDAPQRSCVRTPWPSDGGM